MYKICAKCRLTLHWSRFYKRSEVKRRCKRGSWCKACIRTCQTPERNRRDNLRKAHGMTPEEYNQMVIDQKERCAICFKHQSEFKGALVIDHNHKTNKTRGLLCWRCNSRILPVVENDPHLIQPSNEYLKKHTQELMHDLVA